MKNLFLLLCSALVLMASCQSETTTQPKKIQVGVFDGHGGGVTCIWESVEAVTLDPEMEARTITTGDIANGVLDQLDAVIIPGGSGKRQFMNMGEENHKRIKDFVAGGKGVVGICAGAYFLSSTPNYKCVSMNGAMAIDIEHDNRGRGISKFTLNEEGKKVFPELAKLDTLYIMYYEGPVYVKNEESDINYNVLGMMESDVHVEGNAPANMTNNRPILISNDYGKGRVVSSVAHPEATAGMMWMVPRMVRLALDMPIIEYKAAAVNPNVFGKEILMTKELRDKEATALDVFLNGTAQEKVEMLDWLQSVNSWEAKRLVQGQLFSPDAEVRARAAEYIAAINYLHYVGDVEAAYKSEKDASAKERIGKALDFLKSLR